MNAFKNYYKIDVIDKNEVFEKIENGILLEEKKFEEVENKDVVRNLEGNLKEENNENNEVLKYIKRLKELRRIYPKDVSEEIIKFWNEIQDKYKQNIFIFINNFLEIKNGIIEQLERYQNDFIEFLNNSSNKYKLVDFFYKKYNLFLEKFPSLKNHHLIKEEFENNIVELSANIWELIQERKTFAISELDRIKNQKFIEQNLELFGEIIINLIILETKQFYDKINIIKKFYYEFKKPRLSEKFPYEYIVNEEYLLEDINDYQIFIPNDKKEKNNDKNNKNNKKNSKSNNQTDNMISPKLNKIYENCFKLFFYYQYDMSLLKKKLIEEYNNNDSDQKRLSIAKLKRKTKSIRKRTLKEIPSNFENIIKIINDEEELSLAINNEKIKYKIRILFLKNFAEKKLEEIYSIGQKTFNDLDKYIIDSVNSQNNAMNELILKIKNQMNEENYKLKIKDVELDIFDIYEKSNPNFKEYNLDFLHLIPEEDKIIEYKELYNIYLELKNYEIQNNYVSLNNFFDIVFKKYLFKEKSPAFMKYMEKIPFIYIYEFVNKFITKNSKGNSLIKLNEIFTILGLLNKIPPKLEHINNYMKNINDKLKFKMFLTKNDFISNKLWFENNDDKKKKNKNIKSTSIVESNFENKLKDSPPREKKVKIRGSRPFPKLKFPGINSSKENIKELPDDEQLKEYLFNINKNQEELIDMNNFKNIIYIKKNFGKTKKKIHLNNLSDIKSNVDKDEILSVNSVVESFDKTQKSDSSTNKLLANVKNSGINNPSNNNISKNKKVDKVKILKNIKINDKNNNIVEGSDEKININFLEYTYFDYLIKM